MMLTTAYRADLGKLTTRQVISELGPPDDIVETFAEPHYWRPGQDRPAYATTDPVEYAGMGRCAFDRVRQPDGVTVATIGHPWGPCGWCDVPVEALLAGLDWTLWHARYRESRLLIWHDDDGAAYRRPDGESGYTEPAFARFAGLPPREQTERVKRLVRESVQ